MDYPIIKDLIYAQEILKLTDSDFCNLFNISRTTFFRYKKGLTIPNKNQLETIYSIIYKNKIDLNRIKEELYLSKNSNKTKILFHGSKNGITGNPSIEFGSENKDFGKGFYLGESVKQAVSFISSYTNPSLYIFSLKNYDRIAKTEFDVSIQWMILIAYFRGKIDQYKESKVLKELLEQIKNIDLIIAPIADNTMYSIINEFIEGSITDLQCINCLSANRLGKQYVLLNDDVINSNLEMISKNYICNEEKESYANERLTENDIGKKKIIIAKREYAGKGKYIEQLLGE